MTVDDNNFVIFISIDYRVIDCLRPPAATSDIEAKISLLVISELASVRSTGSIRCSFLHICHLKILLQQPVANTVQTSLVPHPPSTSSLPRVQLGIHGALESDGAGAAYGASAAIQSWRSGYNVLHGVTGDVAEMLSAHVRLIPHYLAGELVRGVTGMT